MIKQLAAASIKMFYFPIIIKVFYIKVSVVNHRNYVYKHGTTYKCVSSPYLGKFIQYNGQD
jgi:hypothetical protein